MTHWLVDVALVAAILGGSALVTRLFARAMYVNCPRCATLNARRRVQCRRCGSKLWREKSG